MHTASRQHLSKSTAITLILAIIIPSVVVFGSISNQTNSSISTSTYNSTSTSSISTSSSTFTLSTSSSTSILSKAFNTTTTVQTLNNNIKVINHNHILNSSLINMPNTTLSYNHGYGIAQNGSLIIANSDLALAYATYRNVSKALNGEFGSSIVVSSNELSQFNNATPLTSNQITMLHNFTQRMAGRFIGIRGAFNISTFNVTYPYGSFTNQGSEIPAGTAMNFSSMDNTTGRFYLYKVKVAKANPNECIYVNLEPVPFCSNATTPSQINIPIINGHYGLTGQDWYPLNVTFKAHLLGNNLASFNFSIIDLTNNTALQPVKTVTTGSLNVNESFRIPITDRVEISFNTAGNANYSSIIDDPVVLPSGIISYVPITLTNSQSSGIPDPFQQMLSVNSLAYQSYEASNLQNIEFFFANGTIMPSWLESGNSNTNTNTIYWLKIPGNVLPATSGNIIYMGFASIAYNLFSNTITGEAPQLSSTYGQYDDGQSVFDYYSVAPTSTSGWTISGSAGITSAAPSGSYFQTTNAYYANSAGGDYMHFQVQGLTTNIIITYQVYSTGLGNMFFLVNSAGNGQMTRLDTRGGGDYSGLATTSSWTSWAAPASGLDEATNTWYKYDTIVTPSTEYSYIGSNSNGLSTLGTASDTLSTANDGNYIGFVGDGLGGSYITYWNGVIIRAYPPSNAMPSASFGTVTSTNAPQLTLTDPITYGALDTIVGNVLNSDYIELLINGNVVAGPSQGSVTYTFNTLSTGRGPGSYAVNAFDVNSLLSSVLSLTVIKATPAITLPNFPANQIYPGTPLTVTANIVTIDNQLTANDYINGAFHASFNTQNNFQESATGAYTVTANTLGNGNYLPASISKTFFICPSASNIPSNIVDYACVMLNNTQNAATPANFQQEVNITESSYSSYIAYNGNNANFEYFYSNGTVIPAWIESNNVGKLTIWIKLNPPIAANGNYVVYLGFASKSTNLLSPSGANSIGENPTLSSSYGQYDDGKSVFMGYFPGSTLNGWTTVGTAGNTISAPSGSPFGTSAYYANGANGDYLYTQAPGQSTNMIIEYYTDTANLDDLFFLVNSAGLGQIARVGNGGGWYGIASSTSWTSWTAPPDSGTWSNEWITMGVTVNQGSATTYVLPSSVNYGAELGNNQANIYSVTVYGNYLGFVGDAAGSTTVQYLNGLIIRAYPPNLVMPSIFYTPAITAPAQNTCTFTVSNTAIDFGSINPGTSIATQNAILVTNTGNTASNILVDGSGWTFASNTFAVSNTIWSWSSGIPYGTANALTATPYDTGVTLSSSTNKNIFFGVNVPVSQAAGTYSQTITISTSC